MKTIVAHGRPLIRAGLRALLMEHDDSAEVREAHTFDELLAATEQERSEILLLDFSLPGLNGFDGLRSLHASRPDIPIVIVTGSENEADVSRAIDSGARGYIPDSSSGELFVNALKLVLSGNIYVPPAALRKNKAESGARLADSPPKAYRLTTLTPRQKEVLSLIAEGNSNREMADKLGIAEGTIRIHVAAILKGLNLRNRTQAALLAVQSEMAGRYAISNRAE